MNKNAVMIPKSFIVIVSFSLVIMFGVIIYLLIRLPIQSKGTAAENPTQMVENEQSIHMVETSKPPAEEIKQQSGGIVTSPAKPEDEILGEWNCKDSSGDSVIWSFYNGGLRYASFWEYDNQYHSTDLIDYNFVDEDQIKIVDMVDPALEALGFPPENRLYKVQITGNSLTMERADGDQNFSYYSCTKK